MDALARLLAAIRRAFKVWAWRLGAETDGPDEDGPAPVDESWELPDYSFMDHEEPWTEHIAGGSTRPPRE